MKEPFPRTVVGGVSLPRFLIGSNWMLGYSHKSHAADQAIKARFADREAFLPLLKTFFDHGIDAIMGPFSGNDHAVNALLYAQDRLGKKLIIIDTPVLDVDDTVEARRTAAAQIRKSAEVLGADFCMIHHASCEQLVNKNTQTIDRIEDYLSMIREREMHPGLSAHMPEVLLYADYNGYDVESYIQIFNLLGFLMQIEVETIVKTIYSARHPVMTIKPMAAGRTTPYIGLTFNFTVLRPQDMVTVGCADAGEAEEDIEIARAALEGRLPGCLGRSSPARFQSVLQANLVEKETIR